MEIVDTVSLEFIIGMIIWISSLISGLIWVNVKLKELDMKSNTNKIDLNKHIEWALSEQVKNDDKIKHMINENKSDHKELVNKVDSIKDVISDLRVLIESK